MQFAHDYPDTVKSLVVIGGPATLSQSSLNPGAWLEQVQREGVESWARSTMGRRLGEVRPAMREWWIQEMGKSSQQVMEGIFRYVRTMDITTLLPQIKAPTLVITLHSRNVRGLNANSVTCYGAWNRSHKLKSKMWVT